MAPILTFPQLFLSFSLFDPSILTFPQLFLSFSLFGPSILGFNRSCKPFLQNRLQDTGGKSAISACVGGRGAYYSAKDAQEKTDIYLR